MNATKDAARKTQENTEWQKRVEEEDAKKAAKKPKLTKTEIKIQRKKHMKEKARKYRQKQEKDAARRARKAEREKLEQQQKLDEQMQEDQQKWKDELKQARLEQLQQSEAEEKTREPKSKGKHKAASEDESPKDDETFEGFCDDTFEGFSDDEPQEGSAEGKKPDLSSGLGDMSLQAAGGSGTGGEGPSRPSWADEVEASETYREAQESLIPASEILTPTRPALVTLGTEVKLFGNYFKINDPPFRTLYYYSFQAWNGNKQATGKKLSQVLTLALFHQAPFQEHKSEIWTDYAQTFLSTVDFGKQTFPLKYFKPGTDPKLTKGTTYTIQIDLVETLDVPLAISGLQQSGSSVTDLQFEHQPYIIQSLNIIFGHAPKADTTVSTVGRHRHFKNGEGWSERLNDYVEVRRGYFCSVRPSETGLLLNVSTTASLMQTQNDLEYHSRQAGDNPFAIHRTIKGLRVINKSVSPTDGVFEQRTVSGLAQDGDGAGKTHRVPYLGASMNEILVKSESGNGFVKLGDALELEADKKDLQAVNLGIPSHPFYAPMEDFKLLPGNISKASLDSKERVTMIDFAAADPSEAIATARKGLSVLGFSPRDNAAVLTGGSQALSVEKDLVRVRGRRLTPPRLIYKGKNKAQQDSETAKWTMTDRKVSDATSSNLIWAALSLFKEEEAVQNDEKLERECLAGLTHELDLHGQTSVMCDRRAIYVEMARDNRIAESIREIKALSSKPTVLLVLLSRQLARDSRVFNYVKRVGDTEHGMHTICVQRSKFIPHERRQLTMNNWKSYCANIGLKINLKLEGTNQRLDFNDLGLNLSEAMIVGYDVTHPAPQGGGKKKAQSSQTKKEVSIAAMVASVNGHFSQWPADVRIQEAGLEIVVDLKEMMRSRLDLWYDRNNRYPKQVIVYRDGVSEGQYKIVMDQEITEILDLLNEIQHRTHSEKRISLTFLVCGKRHNNRFLRQVGPPPPPPQRQKPQQQQPPVTVNPLFGTVVDNTVVTQGLWTFFLQSHSPLKGTARPTHYVVLRDDIFRRGELLDDSPTEEEPSTKDQSAWQVVSSRKAAAVAKASSSKKGPDPKMKPANPADALVKLTNALCFMNGRATLPVSLPPPALFADRACDRANCYVRDWKEETGSPTRPPDSVIELHGSLKDTMFYI